MYSLGLTTPLEQILKKAGITCIVYKDTVANPTSANVEDAKNLYLKKHCQALLAFGGGSSMVKTKATRRRIRVGLKTYTRVKSSACSRSLGTVSLVLGGGHSIGVPLAVSADYSFIVPSATMVLHPVRTNGMFIGVMQTYRNMEKTQDRITGFIAAHSDITQPRLEELMLDTSMLVKDVGTMLEGEDAVREGLINEIGGIREALNKLKELMKKNI